jgi:hypothetical protein
MGWRWPTKKVLVAWFFTRFIFREAAVNPLLDHPKRPNAEA